MNVEYSKMLSLTATPSSCPYFNCISFECSIRLAVDFNCAEDPALQDVFSYPRGVLVFDLTDGDGFRRADTSCVSASTSSGLDFAGFLYTAIQKCTILKLHTKSHKH